MTRSLLRKLQKYSSQMTVQRMVLDVTEAETKFSKTFKKCVYHYSLVDNLNAQKRIFACDITFDFEVSQELVNPDKGIRFHSGIHVSLQKHKLELF
jgi:hypothetical protein